MHFQTGTNFLNYAALPIWVQYLLLAGAIASAVFAIRLFLKKAWPTFKAFVKAANSFVAVVGAIPALTDLPQFMINTAHSFSDIDTVLSEQNQKIEDIHHEVHFNDGSSAKDAIIGVKTVVDQLNATVKGNTTKLTSSLRNQVRIERGVKGLYDESDTLKAKIAGVETKLDNHVVLAAEDLKKVLATQDGFEEELEHTRPPAPRAGATKEET